MSTLPHTPRQTQPRKITARDLAAHELETLIEDLREIGRVVTCELPASESVPIWNTLVRVTEVLRSLRRTKP
jgi:hypothetical protein